MLSVQSYNGLFRPWDVSGKESKETTKLLDRKTAEKKNKRETRLRKIRGQYRKSENLHQDATVSTTTDDLEEQNQSSKEDPVESLSQCCDRLLQEPISKNQITTPSDHQEVIMRNFYPGYNPGLIPSEIAQVLGVAPTDPLLLESLAQGYAMELEYARIIQQENETKLLNARKQRPKKYKCPHCQVGFSNNGQLKGHIRIHTGERPYKCDDKNCGKTFTRNEELTRHKRIHSGVRPYPCGTCGKKFGRRDHLKKHTRTHYMQAERMMPVFLPLSAVPHMAGYPYLYGY